MRSRGDAAEWAQAHLAEAIRIATLLTADPERGPRVAEESLDAALELVPRRRRAGRLGDALLAQLVRHSRADGPAPAGDIPEQLAALRALPRRQRAALVLRHYTELSDDRAAVFLDCSPRAVADLVTRAIDALPPEARSDVHDWLDATPLPRPAATRARKTLLRRMLHPRILRAAAVLTAVAAGVVGGVRLAEVASEREEPPSNADRVAEIRQVLELREASLPFDPDDPGPGASRMFPVVDGVVGGNLWSVAGYRDESGAPCLQLVVAYEFGRRRCLDEGSSPILAVLDVDRHHDATFITGMVDPRIERLSFVGPEVSYMDVTIGRQAPDAPEAQPGFFGIALPDEFVALDPIEARGDVAYPVLRGRLTGVDARGKAVARLPLLFART